MVVFILMMVAAERYILKRNTEVYLESKNEMIIDDLMQFRNLFSDKLYLSVEDYWINNPEKTIQPMTDEEVNYLFEFYNNNGRSDAESFDTLDDYGKGILAKNLKSTLSYLLLYCKNTRGYSDAYFLIPVDYEYAFVVAIDPNDLNIESLYSSSEDDAEYASATDGANSAVESYNEYTFGDIIPFDFGSIKDFSAITSNKDSEVFFADSTNVKNGKAYYTGYLPMYDQNDNNTGVLCVEYDFSDAYNSILYTSTYNVVRNIIVGLFFMAVVLLICLYFVAVKPLRKTKEALDMYKITKNSAEVEERLSQVKARNEIGQFAGNVVQLAKEIDRYTEENIELATKNAKVKTELDLAATIQSESLIKEFPENPYYEVFASMTPAKEVGGDFYNIYDLDDDHTVFVIADVSGKGMAAALFMMAAMTTIRNFSTPGSKPSEIISRVNNTLAGRKIMGMFVTIWLGILDKKTGLLTTSNAGHEYPAVNTTGSFELFKDTHGLVAGGYAGVKYTDHEIQLSKGDTVFVYTDGVPEATNAEGKMFKDTRMLEALNKKPDASPREILDMVKSSVDEFVGDAEQFDDLTMLCIKFNG